jgi:hypothetical protein
MDEDTRRLLMEMHGDLKVVRSVLEENKNKINTIERKVEKLERWRNILAGATAVMGGLVTWLASHLSEVLKLFKV